MGSAAVPVEAPASSRVNAPASRSSAVAGASVTSTALPGAQSSRRVTSSRWRMGGTRGKGKGQLGGGGATGGRALAGASLGSASCGAAPPSASDENASSLPAASRRRPPAPRGGAPTKSKYHILVSSTGASPSHTAFSVSLYVTCDRRAPVGFSSWYEWARPGTASSRHAASPAARGGAGHCDGRNSFARTPLSPRLARWLTRRPLSTCNRRSQPPPATQPEPGSSRNVDVTLSLALTRSRPSRYTRQKRV